MRFLIFKKQKKDKDEPCLFTAESKYLIIRVYP